MNTTKFGHHVIGHVIGLFVSSTRIHAADFSMKKVESNRIIEFNPVLLDGGLFNELR